MVSTKHVQHIANTLKLVRQHLGHTKVPAPFRIPKTHEFPIELHDQAFGNRVKAIRRNYRANQLSKLQIQILEKENMIWNPREVVFQYNLKGLQLYKQIHGNLRILRHFIVPSTKEWPEEYWGFKLYMMASNLRKRKGTLKKHRIEQLNRIGFIWSDLQDRFEKIYFPALQWYKQQFNHAKVSVKYVVPVDDDAIPKDIQGVSIGRFFSRISCENQSLTEMQRKQLHDIGYERRDLKLQYNELVVQLQNYYKQHGSLAICFSYQLDGYFVGHSFSSLVLKKTYYEFYDAKVMQAMGLYRDITDTMFDQIVVSDLDQHRKQKPNQMIYFNTALPNSIVHLGYLKHHCKHPKLVAYIAKHNL